MNNEEKNLQDEEIIDDGEIVETPKKLSKGALIGIIGGAVAAVAVVVVVLVILLSGGGEEPCTHVDANDDYLCDSCGEHFDDGDEAVEPEDNSIEVTFTVVTDDGTPLADTEFTLTRGEAVYTLKSGADGKVKGKLDPGTYAVAFTKFPEGDYHGETYGVKIEQGTTEATLKVINNTLDGSQTKPFVAADGETVTLAAGEELYYSTHGIGLRYIIINNDKLVVTYEGVEYNAEDGKVTVGITPADSETPSVFSIKNPTGESITATMNVESPLGSSENPIELEDSSETVSLTGSQTIYYQYIADKDGVLVLTSPTEGHSISMSRTIYTTNADGEQVALSTTSTGSNSESCGYIRVASGDEVKLGVSYLVENGDDDTETHEVEFSLRIYLGNETDPIPMIGDNIEIAGFDEGAEAVLLCTKSGTLTVNTEGEGSVMHNGASVTAGQSGSFEFNVAEGDRISVSVSSEKRGKITIEIK